MAAEAPLLRIAITPPEPFDGEPEAIERLLRGRRFDIVHLRHPGLSREAMRALLEAVAPDLHPSLRLHDHFDLAADYRLGGVHLNRRSPQPPAGYAGPMSRSCHSIDEVIASRDCDYVTLSPVFDSISKPGYRAAFGEADLRRLEAVTAPRVIALGGVTPENIGQLDRRHFAGYAMLGAAGWGT